MNNDTVLESLIDKIQTGNNKLEHFKAALDRLDELKREYNVLCETYMNSNTEQYNGSIDDIINSIHNEDDLLELIRKYNVLKSKTKTLLKTSQKEKNKFYKIVQDREQIMTYKISELELLQQ